jgi:ABC-type glycerol-3-phosphate transport system substrate-binding protein
MRTTRATQAIPADAGHDRERSTRRAVLAASGVGAFWLAACGAGGAPAGAKELPPATVLFWTGGAGDAEMAPKRAADFEREHAGIKVTTEDPGDLGVKVPTAAAAGTLGDILLQSTSAGVPQIFFLRKLVQGIDSYVQRDKLDLKQWFPHIIDAAKVDGKQFALPFDGKVARVAVWINKTMFDRAGLKLPDLNWTVDQYMDAAVKLTKGSGTDQEWGMATQFRTDFSYVQAYVRRWGADVFDKNGKKATMDTAEARVSFQWAYDMYHTKRVAPIGGTDDKLFESGKGAIMLHRDFNRKPNNLIASKAQGFELWTSVGPKGPTGRRGGFWDFRAAWMPSTSKVKDAAWELVKFLCNKESGLAHALQSAPGTSTTPGARPDIFADPRFLNHPVYPRQIQEMEAESMNSTELEAFPANFRVDELSKVINPYVVKIQNNEAQPTPSFMKEINDAVQHVLDLPREGS